MSSFSDDCFTQTDPYPQVVNGLVIIPFLVKYIAMVVFDKKGHPGQREIQDSVTPVSEALWTYQNNLFLQEKLLLPIQEGERQMVFPNSENSQFNDIINCEKKSAQVMRIVSRFWATWPMKHCLVGTICCNWLMY